MNRTVSVLCGFVILAGLGAFLFWAARLEKRTGLDWKSYPGFRLPPYAKETDEWFRPEEGKDKAGLLKMLGPVLLFMAGALELAGLNTLLPVPLFRSAMLILPPVLLLCQETELVLSSFLLKGKGNASVFHFFRRLKWILLGLWLLCFFASLLIRGFRF